jgi:hypothetical protein
MSQGTLWHRLNFLKWSMEKALTTPVKDKVNVVKVAKNPKP